MDSRMGQKESLKRWLIQRSECCKLDPLCIDVSFCSFLILKATTYDHLSYKLKQRCNIPGVKSVIFEAIFKKLGLYHSHSPFLLGFGTPPKSCPQSFLACVQAMAKHQMKTQIIQSKGKANSELLISTELTEFAKCSDVL